MTNITVTLLVVLTVVSFCNHRYVNRITKDILTNIDANVNSINENITEIKEQHYDKILNSDTIYNSQRLDYLQHNLNDSTQSTKVYVDEVKELRQYIFDANTITFIVSFIFVAVFSFLIKYIMTINQQIENVKEYTNNNYKIDLHLTTISCMHSHAMLGKYILSINKYKITDEFISSIYKIDRDSDLLLREMKEDIYKGLRLREDDKTKMIKMIIDINNNIDLDEIKKHNSGGYGTTEILMANLEELERVIADIEEIQES